MSAKTARALSEIAQRHDRFIKALQEILETKPQISLNGNCRVNDPDAIMWNVHRIAAIALGRLDEKGCTEGHVP